MKNIFYNLNDKRLGPLSNESLSLIKILENKSDYLTFTNGSIIFHKDDLKYKIIYPTLFDNNISQENLIINCDLYLYVTENFNLQIFENKDKFKRCFIFSKSIETLKQYEVNIALNKLENNIYCVYLGDKKNIRSIDSFFEIFNFINTSLKVHLNLNKTSLDNDFFDIKKVLSELKLNKIGNSEYANYKIGNA